MNYYKAKLNIKNLPHFLIFLSLVFIFSDLLAQNETKSSVSMSDFDELPKIRWEFITIKPLFSSPVISEKLDYFDGTHIVLYAISIDSEKEE